LLIQFLVPTKVLINMVNFWPVCSAKLFKIRWPASLLCLMASFASPATAFRPFGEKVSAM